MSDFLVDRVHTFQQILKRFPSTGLLTFVEQRPSQQPSSRLESSPSVWRGRLDEIDH